MKQLFITILSIAAIAAFAGCGSSSGSNNGNGNGGGDVFGGGGGDRSQGPTANPLSCTQDSGRGFTFCTELSGNGLSQDQVQQIQSGCTNQNPQGQFTQAACAQEQHVGTCVMTKEGHVLKVRFYSPVTADAVKQACDQQHGSFQAGF